MLSKMKPFALLIEYLSRSDAEEIFSAHAKAFAFSVLDYTIMADEKAYTVVSDQWNIAYQSMDSTQRFIAYGKAIYGMWQPRQTLGNINIYSMTNSDDRDKKMDAPIHILAVLNDAKDKTLESTAARIDVLPTTCNFLMGLCS